MNNLNKYDETLFIPMQAIAGTRCIRPVSQKSMVNSVRDIGHALREIRVSKVSA
ncbi:hypothetical protein FB107DRAFT_262858 [Schizophyllum commune]